jgi:thymidylate synthase (FAD)
MVKMVQESYTIITDIVEKGEEILALIEEAGRTCYQSSHKIEPGSAKKFVEMILKRGHESVLEHFVITVRFITNRGMTHELVRHRIGISFSQESTRFCDYCNDKFGNEITVIDQREHIMDCLAPEGHQHDTLAETKDCANSGCSACKKIMHAVADWTMAMACAEDSYKKLRADGLPAEYARDVLPNDLKTDIVVTANLREWRHVFSLRTAKGAHFNIRTLMRALCEYFKSQIPVVFDDIEW